MISITLVIMLLLHGHFSSHHERREIFIHSGASLHTSENNYQRIKLSLYVQELVRAQYNGTTHKRLYELC